VAVIIRNLGGNLDGTCNYEVRVNEDVIATFAHNRPDGLATCLRIAANAVDRQREKDLVRMCEAVAGKIRHTNPPI